MTNTYISVFYGFIAIILLAGSFWVKPETKGWLFCIFVIVGFLIGGLILGSYMLASSAVIAGIVSILRFRQNTSKTRPLEVIFIQDHEDQYLQYFLDYYHDDITKFFPKFDFKIEEEFLVALILSKMETVGVIIAEIKNVETLRICIDYMVPKYRESELAKTFYNCELRCIDFLDYRYLYFEPQSKAHNDYLKRIGFRLVDGKYVIQCSGK
ncbi:MAG: hypothetical protein GZ094_11185 [Mariniphaga sp.]|nr:hypothetical protein [Mariniphaga sp.]